jgi:predicted  nucleic acid-binding Zn-ribbon protein
LESKELHLGLVQKKVVALEDRLQTYSHREADWENTTSKARKIERQLERLQDRASLQRETITKLKAETSEAEALRVGTKLSPPPAPYIYIPLALH